MKYHHVDVFSSEPMKGNGLIVVFPEQALASGILLRIAQEFRQFETIYIFSRQTNGSFPVRIFTTEEELGFAGHPILGAGAVLHSLIDENADEMNLEFLLPEKAVKVRSQLTDTHHLVTMNQGIPQFIHRIQNYNHEIANNLNILPTQLNNEFPIEVVSTGLPYLLVPIRQGIDRVKIMHQDFEKFLAAFGAKFAYIFETETLECRTWNNSGTEEDVATGSAAGPLCAYLVRNQFRRPDEIINISQGKYLQRPSIIRGWVEKESGQVYIQGDVAFFGKGEIFL